MQRASFNNLQDLLQAPNLGKGPRRSQSLVLGYTKRSVSEQCWAWSEVGRTMRPVPLTVLGGPTSQCVVHSGRERGNAPTAPTSSGMEAAVMSPGSVVSSVSMAPSRPRSSALDSSPDFSSLVSVSPFCACVRENCDVRAGEKG